MAEVEKDLRERDNQDKKRSIAPLRPAKDAKIIDSTTLNAGQVIEIILKSIKN